MLRCIVRLEQSNSLAIRSSVTLLPISFISDSNILNSETKNTMFQFSIKFSLIQLGSGKGNPK